MFIQSDPKVTVRQAGVKKVLQKQVSMSGKHCLFFFLIYLLEAMFLPLFS